MEITIEKANGKPMSEKEAADLIRFLRRQLKPLIDIEVEDCPFEPDNCPHDVELFLQEDDSYVYAAALCPGISKDRLEVQIDGLELFIRTKPADSDTEKDPDSCGHSPWKFFDDVSYEGEAELPTEVIAEEATAELSNGVLYIKLPKPDAAKPKSVTVK